MIPCSQLRLQMQNAASTSRVSKKRTQVHRNLSLYLRNYVKAALTRKQPVSEQCCWRCDRKQAFAEGKRFPPMDYPSKILPASTVPLDLSNAGGPPVEVQPIYTNNHNYYSIQPTRRRLAKPDTSSLGSDDDMSIVEIPIDEDFRVQDTYPTGGGFGTSTYNTHTERRRRMVQYRVPKASVRPAAGAPLKIEPLGQLTGQPTANIVRRRDFAGSRDSAHTI